MDRELSSSLLVLPVAIVAVSVFFSVPLSLVIAFIITAVVSFKNIYYSVPVVLFGSGFQLMGIYFGVHYGWFIMIGALLGVFSKLVVTRKLRIDIFFTAFIFLFLFISFYHLMYDASYSNRYFGLLFVLFYCAFLVSPSQVADSENLRKSLLIAISFAGLCIGLSVFGLFSSQQLSVARAHEMSLTIGDTQSSPRLLTTVLGFVFTVTFLALVVEKERTIIKLLYLASTLIVFLAMVYAGSRMPLISSLMAVTLGVLLYLSFNFRKLPRRVLLWLSILLFFIFLLGFLIFIVGVSALPFVPDSVESLRVTRQVNIEDNARLSLWGSYFDLVSYSKLLIGIGLGSFGNPHSFWIGSFMAFGLIGAIPIFLFFMTRLFQSIITRAIYPFSILVYILFSVFTSSDVDRMQPWIILSMACLFYILNLNHWKRINEHAK